MEQWLLNSRKTWEELPFGQRSRGGGGGLSNFICTWCNVLSWNCIWRCLSPQNSSSSSVTARDALLPPSSSEQSLKREVCHWPTRKGLSPHLSHPEDGPWWVRNFLRCMQHQKVRFSLEFWSHHTHRWPGDSMKHCPFFSWIELLVAFKAAI